MLRDTAKDTPISGTLTADTGNPLSITIMSNRETPVDVALRRSGVVSKDRDPSPTTELDAHMRVVD